MKNILKAGRKQTKLQWLKNPSQMKGCNMKNWGNTWKTNVTSLEQMVQTKTSEICREDLINLD
jgi:hypothetical protein